VTTVVDDATLLAVLACQAAPGLQTAANNGEVLTTTSWYYRLNRALRDPRSQGHLSSMAARLPDEARAALFTVIEDLPPEIGLVHPRRLVPVMASLRLSKPVNFLAAEALGVALLTDADIRISTESPGLTLACDELDVYLELRSPFD
jgi:hypothetical protein